MKYMKGDLLTLAENGVFNLIIQGNNIFNTMGGGIAASIAKKFPEAYQADLQTVKGDRKKLGTYTFAVINGLTVVNAYTQATFWDPTDMLDYDAVDKVMEKIANDFPDKNIGMPLIGAGLAMGKWERLAKVIEKHLPNATIVVFNQADWNKHVESVFDNTKDVLLSQ